MNNSFLNVGQRIRIVLNELGEVSEHGGYYRLVLKSGEIWEVSVPMLRRRADADANKTPAVGIPVPIAVDEESACGQTAVVVE